MLFRKNPLFVKYINFLKDNNGLLLFHIGIFLLFSAPAISALLILFSLLFKKKLKENSSFEKYWRYLLYLVAFFMILSWIIFELSMHTNSLLVNNPLFTEPKISYLNWLPFFIFFFNVEVYLSNDHLRKYFGFFLICSSIPILISGFAQEFFQIYGPKEILNGLVIWYQRPNQSGMTGLFNNQNYTGCALGIVLPFVIASLNNSKKNVISFLLIFLIFGSTIFGLLLTNSRNAWLSFPIILFFLINKKFNFLKYLIFSLGSFFSIYSANFVLEENKYLDNLQLSNITNDPRVKIYLESLNYILHRPLFGWGGNGFSSIWNLDPSKENYFAHSHNIFLELSIQYGLITSILFLVFICFLIFLSFKSIYILKENNSDDIFFDKAWITSSLIMVNSNLLDIPYYDIRISILFWILLAGLKRIISENHVNIEKET